MLRVGWWRHAWGLACQSDGRTLVAIHVDSPPASRYNSCTKPIIHSVQILPMSIHVSYLAEEVDGVAPGVRIIVPMDGSPQAQRGSFCALVDLQGVPDADALVERVLSAMQRTYFSERGTQSQVITETVRRAQAMIASETQRLSTPWRAGVVCVGVMADRLALAGLGGAFALMTAEDGSVGIFPPDRLASPAASQPRQLELWPLHRQKTSGATAMIAGSGDWLSLVPVRTLAATTAYVDAGNCIDAADGLREQAGRDDLPGIVLVIDPGASPPAAPPGGGSEPPPKATPKPPSTLPTAVNASPPITSAPDVDASDPSPPPLAAVMASSTFHSTVRDESTVSMPARPTADTAEEVAPALDAPDTATETPAAASAARLAAGARVGLARAQSLLANMLPERREALPPAMMTEAAMAGAPAYTAMPPAPVRVQPAAAPFSPPDPTSGGRARVLIAGAVILLLLVPAIVATLYWRQGAEGRVEADTLLNLAEARYASAVEALDQGDAALARKMLTEAETSVRQAEEIGGRTTRSGELMTLIEGDRKSVERVAPLYGLALPLITFAAESVPRQLVVNGQDIYVLDAGRNEIVTYRLAPDGESLASPDGQAVLRAGDTVDGVQVGAPIDMAWQPPVPGYDDKSSLLILDDANHIFRYNQQVDGASLVRFGDAAWESATQIETYMGRLYVADQGANQIFRYDIGNYAQGTPWFQATTRVNLAGLKTMRIDGDLWLLYEDGKVLRYRSGEQLPFSLDNSIALAGEADDLWVGQDGDDAIYLTDRLGQRILVFAKENGAYLEQFQAAEGTPLQDLRTLFIDRAHSIQYLLTDRGLYQERLPR